MRCGRVFLFSPVVTSLAIRTHVGLLKIGMSTRTSAVIHLAGERDEINSRMADVEAYKWMGQFQRHRVMVIVFLGPTTGVQLRVQRASPFHSS